MLNENMLQRIDIVIYSVLMNRGAMVQKSVYEGRMCVMPLGTIGMMQAFRLGMMWMISRYFASNVSRNNEVFDI